jgi:hypothetical protein
VRASLSHPSSKFWTEEAFWNVIAFWNEEAFEDIYMFSNWEQKKYIKKNKMSFFFNINIF